MIGNTYFHPLLSNHLHDKFGFTVEAASSFFILNMVSYFIVLPSISRVTKKLGSEKTIFLGLCFYSVGALMISPTDLFPQ